MSEAFGTEEFLDPNDERPEARERLRGWLELQRRGAFDPRAAREALRHDPDPHRAWRLLEKGQGVEALSAPLLETTWRRLGRLGTRAIPLGSPLYPARIAALDDPAPLLWVRGRLASLPAPSVAIVGARAATATGLSFARRLARELAGTGLAIVSGLARGIDRAAHEGALEAGGVTLAVLGCGPDRVYPREHTRLAEAIAQRGAVVSELPPGTPPLAHHFPLRNRLISGLARAVVIVEARLRSGSLLTARHGLDQGREVLAVPGAVDAPTSEGPNRLLRDGAPPVLETADVLHALGCEPVAKPRAAESPSHPLLAALRREPLTRDELARRLDRPAYALARELLALELEGRVIEDRDGRLRAV